MKIHYSPLFLGLVLLSTISVAQVEEKKEEDMYVLSLEQLMNIPIKSASKKEETLFDAPLSSYTITRSEIDKAGSTSIMEALRLSPGVIVREQANGVYDIHIRGMENLSRTNGTFLKTDAYTLVMIDNRPVFNHGLGGTFWESLPIDINDVERIEIVRGPSSPLFGPNAVTGVINIITKRMGEAKQLVNANVQVGNAGTSISNLTVGQAITNKLNVMISGNLQDRQRNQTEYYNEQSGTYVPLDVLIPNQQTRDARYAHSTRSLNKWGLNANLNYKFSDKTSVDFTMSRQMASSQRIFVTNPLVYSNTNNTSANLALTIHSFKLRTSYLMGYNSDIKADIPNGQTDFNVGDINAEYDFKIAKKYTITPGISYQNVKFDDTKYTDPNAGSVGYWNNKVGINTTAGFVRSDLNFTNKFRVIAALRVDKFSVPDKAYLAYELATTYKLNEKNLIRAAITKSNSGSFIGYNYLNISGAVIPDGYARVGDTNLKIFTIQMAEIGYRSQLAKNLQVDMDVFLQKAENLTTIVQKATTQQFANIPTTAIQQGLTVSVNYVATDKIQIKPFITWQKTETKKLPSLWADPSIAPVTYSDSKHRYTPASYGGFYINYRPVSKFNVNLSGYYFTKQSQYDQSWQNGPNQVAQGQISGKLMINAKVSYEVLKGLNVFFNARNLGSTSKEFYAADKTSGLYLAGASFHFNR